MPVLQNSDRSSSSTNYCLPHPPIGLKFRAIPRPGHETAVGLTLICGRYYPAVLQFHDCTKPFLQKVANISPGATSDTDYWRIILEFVHRNDTCMIQRRFLMGSRQQMLLAGEQEGKDKTYACI